MQHSLTQLLLALLRAVDNIEPPAFGQKGETYSMYIFAQSVFQNDIVSTSLRHNQNWEGMESYSHIGHLDMVARVRGAKNS